MADKRFNLWVFLGLKDTGYKRGLDKNQRDTASFANVVRGTVKGTSEAFKNLGGISGALKLGVVAGSAMLVASEFKKAIAYSIEFEKTLSNLRALTGASAADMKYYREAATEVGTAMGKTGLEMAEAFKVVGSGKSELLKNKEGLVEVTTAAITLSKASGEDLKTSADSLVVAMNQFNAPAREANRYINAMTAGAKEGAAEVPNLTASLTKFGSVAAALQIPIEQSIAMIEALSEKGLKDEVAGTGIKSFLLKLEKGAKDTRPSVVGLEQALDNLKKKNLSVNEAQKIFGEEAANVAIALISQTGRIKELTSSVTGTNEAFKQAQINGDNVAGALSRLDSGWTNFKENLLNSKGGLTSFLKDLLLDLNQVLDGASLLMLSPAEKVEAKEKRSYQRDVESYKKTLGADSNKKNIEQDIKDFNAYLEGWQKRYAEARSKNDVEEIYHAGYKVKLYKELIRLGKETLNPAAPAGKSKGGADGSSDDAGDGTKKSPLQRYKEEMVGAKKLYDTKQLSEKEYSEQRISNIKKYLEEIGKEGRTDIEKANLLSSLKIKLVKDSYNEQLAVNEKLHDQQLKTDEEYLDEKIAAVKKYLDQLAELGKTDEVAFDSWSKMSADKLRLSDFENTEQEAAKIELDTTAEVPIVFKTDKEIFQEQLDAIQSNLHPLELEVAISNTQSAVDAVNSISSIGSAVENLESKMADGSAGFMDYFNVISSVISGSTNLYNAITQVIANVTALQAVNATTAAAQKAVDISKVAGQEAVGVSAAITSTLIGLPFPANLAAAPASGAAAMAMYAPAMAMLAFADGGVVPGSSFNGDGVLARVNSAEMILNTSQQAKLFSMLSIGGGDSNGGDVAPTVKVRGEDLYITFNNFLKRKKLIG